MRKILFTTTSTLLFFLSVSLLFSCDSTKVEKSEKTIFRNQTKCDSTSIERDEFGNKTFSCFKDSTKSYLITSENGDSIFMKRFLDPNFVEKFTYENNKLISASLNFVIDLENRKFEHNILNFKIKNNQIDKDSSFFYEFQKVNDSTFFRINVNYKYLEPFDSVKVSKWGIYFSSIGLTSNSDYADRSANKNTWFYLSDSGLKDSVKSIIIMNVPKDPEFVSSFTQKYISPKIIRWNNEFFERFR